MSNKFSMYVPHCLLQPVSSDRSGAFARGQCHGRYGQSVVLVSIGQEVLFRDDLNTDSLLRFHDRRLVHMRSEDAD